MIRDLRALGPIIRLFFAERRGILVGGVLMAAAAVICGILLLGLAGWFITATALAGLSAATALAFDVFAPAAGIRFLALARTATRYGERLVTHDATLRVLAALRERLFRGWAEASSARKLTLRPARILFRLTLDLDAMDSLYLRVLVPIGAALCGTLLAAVILGFMSVPLGIAAGAVLIIVGFGIPLAATAAARRPARRRAYAMEALRSRVIDLVSGQKELVMAGQLNAQRRAIAAADRRLLDADNALNAIETTAGAAFGIASAALLAGTLMAVALLSQGDVISAPVAVLGLLTALTVLEPFAALRRGAIEFGRTVLAARRIGRRIDDVRHESHRIAPDEGFAVQMNEIATSYPGSATTILHDISLAVRAGERVAVIGKSGAGKSTLLALVAGDVLALNGPFRALPATLFTQRTELFQDTLRDNLLLADPTATDERLCTALQAAGLGRDVAALPDGLETRLGEGGMGLSGGQARRLALARLLLNKAPLWLLDEPTEGLDGDTARDVIRRIVDQAQGRTLLVATHIRREAEIADRLLIMDHGRIIATKRRGEPGFEGALALLRPD